MKILIGGSPCTHWSIAQTKNRETEASGIGWELFLNYRIACDKYQPDYFLYENNKSMSSAIRAQITAELGVEPVLINSALVSAQNRQRLYWVGKRNLDGTYSQVPVEQPIDRGILLRDILETGYLLREKSYALKPLTEREMAYMVRETKDGRNHFDFDYFHDATKDKGACVTANTHKGVPYNVLAEPIIVNGTENGKSRTVDAHMGKLENNLVPRINNPNPAKQQYDCIVEPIRIGIIENNAKNQDHDSQQYRVYSPDGKSVTLCGNGGGIGAKTGLYATPVAGRIVGRRINEQGHRDDYNEAIERVQRFEVNENPDKTNCLSTVEKDNMVAIPAGMAWRGREDGSAFEMRGDQKSNTVAATGHQSRLVIEAADGKQMPVYEVRGGRITIKGKTYPIKLADGFYIIRKLTVTECKRLQTVPDTYAFPVSDTQAYKMLGNGWTVDVIAHIMSHFEDLMNGPVEVLSMYDGMSCGHIALDKLGVKIARYHATEIDKYAMQTTQANFPDTVQLGDAFQVREDSWTGGGLVERNAEEEK